MMASVEVYCLIIGEIASFKMIGVKIAQLISLQQTDP